MNIFFEIFVEQNEAMLREVTSDWIYKELEDIYDRIKENDYDNQIDRETDVLKLSLLHNERLHRHQMN